MFFVAPSLMYLEYMNYKVIVMMFTLMIAIGGIYDTHFFDYIATKLVLKFKSIQMVGLVIILVTFFLAMLLTNDAVLLTLIPFTIFITKHTKTDKYALYIIILQTIAANLGSALTPMGDPQNIYLYAFYDIPFSTFISYTFPITALGFAMIISTTFILLPQEHIVLNIVAPQVGWKKFFLYMLLIINALLLVLRVYDVFIASMITFLFVVLIGRSHIKDVDYGLIMTFIAFFIITGNLSQLDFIRRPLVSLLSSDTSVYLSGLITSQFISNVPAAVLLSTFTDSVFTKALLQGVNVGAMGSIIGSLASLISFKYIIKLYPKMIKSYLMKYTLISVVFILMMTCFLLIIL